MTSENSTSDLEINVPGSNYLGLEKEKIFSDDTSWALIDNISENNSILAHEIGTSTTELIDEEDYKAINDVEYDKKIGDSQISAIIKDFSIFLLDRIEEISILKGTIIRFEIYRYQSEIDKELRSYRIEMHIPTLPRNMQFTLWNDYSEFLDNVSKDFLKKIGTTSTRGRCFRSIINSISGCIVPY